MDDFKKGFMKGLGMAVAGAKIGLGAGVVSQG